MSHHLSVGPQEGTVIYFGKSSTGYCITFIKKLNEGRPGATGGAFRGRAPPKLLLVPPKQEFCPSPSEDCAPKKLTTSVLLECNSRPETPKILVTTPQFVSKNCCFVDFAIKTVCFCGFTPEFMKIRVHFAMKTLFFGLHLRFRENPRSF